MNLSNHSKAVIALIIANIIWGAAPPIFKWSLENIQPFTLAFLRFAIAAFILFPFAKNALRIAKSDLPKLFLMAAAGITINISFFFLGLKHAASINAPIIASSAPLFIILASFFILHDRINKKQILGAGAGFIGVFLIVARPLIEHGIELSFIGNLFFVIATFGAIANIILAKKLAKTYKSITLTFYSFLIGGLSFVPFFVSELMTYGFLSGLNIQGISGILFGTFLSSLAAYLLFYFAIEKLHASEVGIFTYIDPVIAVIIAIPLLHEIPTPTYLLGSALVFLGIYIAEGRLPYHPIHKL